MHSEKSHQELLSYVLRIAVGGLLLVMGIGKFSGGVETFVTSTLGMFDGTLMPLGVAKAYLTPWCRFSKSSWGAS